MRTTAIVDCRYCPDPKRVAATSSALTLHAVAFLALLIPISIVKVPLASPKPPDVMKARIIDDPPPKTVVPVTSPPPKAVVRRTQVVVPKAPTVAPPIFVDEARPGDVFTEAPGAVDDIAPSAGDAAPPGDVPLIPTSIVKPIYPRAELARGIEGETLVWLRVDLSGSPVQVKVQRSSGNVNLDRAALDAVRKWRFEPAVRNGAAVEVEVTVPVRFSVLSG